MSKKEQNRDSNTDLFLKFMRRKNETVVVEEETSVDENFLIGAFDRINVGLNAINSMLDRVLSTNSAIKVLSLCLTIILVFAINGGSISNVFTTPTSGDILSSVDVSVEGLSKDYVVTGVPDTVDIMMVGSSLDIYSAKASNDVEVYIDVTNLSRGEHTVELKTRNFPTGLQLVVQPSSTVINIASKVTQTFPLTHRFVNMDDMDERYSISIKEFAQENIEVRAAQSIIEQIYSVEANIDVAGVTESFTQEAKIYAYDRIGTILPVEITPSLVEVQCDVTSYSKEVNVVGRIQGALEENVAIKNISFDFDTITIYGRQEMISTINEVYVDIDATLISKDTVLEDLMIKSADGINKFSQTIVTATIKVGELSTKTLKNISFNYVNNTEKYDLSDDDQTVSITVQGEKSLLDALNNEDITATIDVKGIEPGVHELPVVITLHNHYLSYEFVGTNIITITIKD